MENKAKNTEMYTLNLELKWREKKIKIKNNKERTHLFAMEFEHGTKKRTHTQTKQQQ